MGRRSAGGGGSSDRRRGRQHGVAGETVCLNGGLLENGRLEVGTLELPLKRPEGMVKIKISERSRDLKIIKGELVEIGGREAGFKYSKAHGPCVENCCNDNS